MTVGKSLLSSVRELGPSRVDVATLYQTCKGVSLPSGCKARSHLIRILTGQASKLRRRKTTRACNDVQRISHQPVVGQCRVIMVKFGGPNPPMTQSKVDTPTTGGVRREHQVWSKLIERVPGAALQCGADGPIFLHSIKVSAKDTQATETQHGLLNLEKEGVSGLLVARIAIDRDH